MFESYDDILTVPEIAEILKIGRTQVYKMLKSGRYRVSSLEKIGRYPDRHWPNMYFHKISRKK